MNNRNKSVLFIYFTILGIFFLTIFLIPFGSVSYTSAQEILSQMFYKYKWFYAAGAAVMVLLNVKFIIVLLEKEAGKGHGIAKYTSEGEVVISIDTIKEIAMRAGSSIKGIKDMKVYIKPNKENISILIKVSVLPDLNIPKIVLSLQEGIKSYVQSITEIPVGEVKVSVVELAARGNITMK